MLPGTAIEPRETVNYVASILAALQNQRSAPVSNNTFDITINTQATDGKGVAIDFMREMQKRDLYRRTSPLTKAGMTKQCTAALFFGSRAKCAGNSRCAAADRATIDCSSGKSRPRRVALIQSAGSVPNAVAPSPAYPIMATPSVVSKNMNFRASSFGRFGGGYERRRSASIQIVLGPFTVKIRVTACGPYVAGRNSTASNARNSASTAARNSGTFSLTKLYPASTIFDALGYF